MSNVSTATPDSAGAIVSDPVKSQGYWRGVGKRVMRDKVTLVCGAILLVMLFLILFAPWIAPYDPLQGSMARRLKPVGWQGYLLGTDELGRDMLTRLMYGGRFSWFVGITPVVCAFTIGGTLGVLAGFVGGKINMLIMRATDVFYAFPSVLLAVAVDFH